VLSLPPYPTLNLAGTLVEIMYFRVPVAVFWILIAGKEVFQNEEVTAEKWTFWQRRFIEIGEMGELEEETRKVALEAAKKMGVIAEEIRATVSKLCRGSIA
jgi:hypothetical protein